MALLGSLLCVASALAQDPGPAVGSPPDRSPADAAPRADAPPTIEWNFGVGAFQVFGEDKTAEVGVQARWAPWTLGRIALRPIAGLAINADEGFWVYGGAAWELPFADRFVATPSFAVTAYEDGDGRRLGGTLEFRSGIDIERQLPRGGRIGLSLYHLSNAGINEFNPGSESLLFTWSPRARPLR